MPKRGNVPAMRE